jgi:four helix bundle protein
MDKPHRKLVAWQKAMDLSVLTYRLTDTFPRSELFGLGSQMRRSAVSIASNLAEGAARRGRKEMLQFLNIARGSLSELDTQFEVAFRVGYISEIEKNRLDALMREVDRLLYGLCKVNDIAGERAGK